MEFVRRAREKIRCICIYKYMENISICMYAVQRHKGRCLCRFKSISHPCMRARVLVCVYEEQKKGERAKTLRFHHQTCIYPPPHGERERERERPHRLSTPHFLYIYIK